MRRHAAGLRALALVVVVIAAGQSRGQPLVSNTAAGETYVRMDLGTLGGSRSRAYDINKRAQVVGGSTTSSGDEHAFLWQGGTMTDIGALPGGTYATAYGINRRGQVVGHSQSAATTWRAFLWQAGTFVDLGSLASTWSRALDINKKGHVVGWSDTAGDDHAVLWKGGAMIDLGAPPGDFSVAFAINNRGYVVGSYGIYPNDTRACLWKPSKSTRVRNSRTTREAAQFAAR